MRSASWSESRFLHTVPRPAEEGFISRSPELENRADESLVCGIGQSALVGVVRLRADGSTAYASPHARALLSVAELTDDALTLDNFRPFTIYPDGTKFPAEDYPASKCLATGEPQGPEIMGIRGPSGETVWLNVSAVPDIDSTTGKQVGAITAFVDVSHSVQVEASLRETDDRYRRLVEEAPDPIVVHRDGKIVFVNDAGARLWAAENRADILGRSVLDFVHPRDRKQAEQRIQRIQTGEPVPRVDQLHVRLDGRKVRVEVTGMPCVYDGKPSVQTILRNVTRRRRIERQVRRQREILRMLFDRIPLLIVIFDPDGRIKMVNREWHRVLGWGTDLDLPEVLRRCYPDQEVRQRAADFMRNAPSGWFDSEIQLADGETRVMASAVVVLSDGTRIGIGQDITERTRAEAELRRHKGELEDRVRMRTEALLHNNEQLQAEIGVRRATEQKLNEKQESLEQMLDTHEQYRKLVAYEIHDTFVQDVVGALMYLDMFCDDLSGEIDTDTEQVDKARELLRKAVAGARRMISALRPPVIDEKGLIAALDYLISELNAQGMSVRLVHELLVARLSPVAEAALFRIVQEALTNVQRHSGTKFADVQLMQLGDRIRLRIRDKGAGFDRRRSSAGHFGLRGIQERARLLGGSATIKSAPDEGTEILVDVPVATDKGPTTAPTKQRPAANKLAAEPAAD